MSEAEALVRREGGAAEASPFVTDTTIKRQWAVLPGRELVLRLRMYLSGELAAAREGGLGLTKDERATALIDMRIRIIADTLVEPPTGFPNFPESVTLADNVQSTSLRDRAYAYFNQRDGEGRLIFQFFIEDVIEEYWRRVLPSAYFPPTKDTSETG